MTNEGIRHCKKPWMSVQFHPAGIDTGFLFDRFLELVEKNARD
jgi:carbamoylphosphate synthase small subunit